MHFSVSRNHIILYLVWTCEINESHTLLLLFFSCLFLNNFAIIHFLENYGLVY